MTKVVGSIVVVSALVNFAFIHFVCDLKGMLMNLLGLVVVHRIRWWRLHSTTHLRTRKWLRGPSPSPSPQAQSLEQWGHWKSVFVITAEAALRCNLSRSGEFLAPSLLEVGSSSVNRASPFWSVHGIFLQVSRIDVAPQEIGFDHVFILQFLVYLGFFWKAWTWIYLITPQWTDR